MKSKNSLLQNKKRWLPSPKVGYYLILLVTAAIMIFPFYWMVVTSFKTGVELSVYPPRLLPQKFYLGNYQTVLSSGTFPIYFRNSVICAVAETLLMLVVTVFSAYGFYRLPGKKGGWMTVLLWMTNIVPFEIVMVFQYRMMISWGLNDTLTGLILPFLFNFTYVYIFYQAFRSIPNSLCYAAYTDKTTSLKFLFRIALPYIKPTVVFVCMLNVINCWNSFLWPLMMTNSVASRTLPLGLYAYIPEDGSRTELLMAMSVLMQLPPVVMFLVLQKHLLRGFRQK